MDNIPVRQELIVVQHRLLQLLLRGRHTLMDSTCRTQVTLTLPHIVNRHIHNHPTSNTLIFREKVRVVEERKKNMSHSVVKKLKGTENVEKTPQTEFTRGLSLVMWTLH